MPLSLRDDSSRRIGGPSRYRVGRVVTGRAEIVNAEASHDNTRTEGVLVRIGRSFLEAKPRGAWPSGHGVRATLPRGLCGLSRRRDRHVQAFRNGGRRRRAENDTARRGGRETARCRTRPDADAENDPAMGRRDRARDLGFRSRRLAVATVGFAVTVARLVLGSTCATRRAFASRAMYRHPRSYFARSLRSSPSSRALAIVAAAVVSSTWRPPDATFFKTEC